MENRHLSLGSLFDGIGGFPYAASFYNITPLWASEILPAAVSVTRHHFPGMEHVGDITQLHGGKLPPVDIITFGSPCQGLSMAGRRLGLADERSGLFNEAIRIIKEMQEATNGKYPKIALWENVPGALSTAGGLDFKSVLEAFTASKLPMPESGRWAKAGMVRGRGVDLAWCVYNAQYFGVAQRRRRIFLVADFTGQRAGEILFVPKSLRRYFEAGGTPRQAAAAYAQSCAGTADEQPGIGFDGYNGDLTGENAATLGVNCGMSTGRNGVLQQDESGAAHTTTAGGNEIASTLYAAYGTRWNGNAGAYSGDHFVAEPRPVDILNDQGGDSLSVEKSGVSPTLRSETHGNLPVVAHQPMQNCLNGWDTQQSRVYTEDGQAPTLAGADGGGGRNPAGLVYAAFMGGQSATAGSIAYSEKVSPTLRGSSGANMTPCVCEPEPPQKEVYPINTQLATRCNKMGRGTGLGIGADGDPAYTLQEAHSHAVAVAENPVLCAATGQSNAEILENRSATLVAGHEQPIVCKAVGVHQNQAGELSVSDAAYTLSTCANASARNAPLVAHPKVSGTLCGSGAGLSRTAGMASETDLCVVQEAIPIHDRATRCSGGGDTRNNDGSGNGLGVGKKGDPAPTITAGDRHAVAAVDCRNLKENGDLSGTLQAKASGSYSLNYQNPVRTGYIVRRLTPTECERLQGFPDGWTESGHDGKPMSDTKRYQMLGNSIAVPCAAYIMEGITQALTPEGR